MQSPRTCQVGSEARPRDYSAMTCAEQWAALADTPQLMRWWHFVSLTIDNLIAGLVYGWAWYQVGASWRIAPAVAYACLGTAISLAVLGNGPAATLTKLGPLMGAVQVYMSAFPLFQTVDKVSPNKARSCASSRLELWDAIQCMHNATAMA